jgi:hypothetical protein
MQVDNNSRLNFGARFLKPVQIKKMSPRPKMVDVSYIELEPYNKNDVKALNKVVKLWYDAFFISDINYIFRKMHYEGNLLESKPKIFALTLQKKNFDKLFPEDILGVMEVWKKDWGSEVKYLETNPEFAARVPNAYYKDIVKCLVDALKEKCNHFKLHAMYSAATFWERMGLKMVNSKHLEYEWLAKEVSKK